MVYKHEHSPLASSTALYIVIFASFAFSLTALVLGLVAVLNRPEISDADDFSPQTANLDRYLENSVRLSENLYMSNDTVTKNGIRMARYIHLFMASDVAQKRSKFVGPPNLQKLDTCQPGYTTGVRWKVAENWMLNTANQVGLSDGFVSGIVQKNLGKWNSAASFGIYGGRIPWTGNGPDFSAPDGKNEWDFGPIDTPGVLAFTVTWGKFDNFPVDQREIFEWDIRVDDRDYSWGDASEDTDVYDFEEVGCHESGHGAGLSDVYTSGCQGVVMFGSVRRGQFSPRSPTPEDIKSLCQLYGCATRANSARMLDSKDPWVLFLFTAMMCILLL